MISTRERERYELERERSRWALAYAEAELAFLQECRARDRELEVFRLEERERELERERRELWAGGLRVEGSAVLEAVPVSENRFMYSRVVMALALRELELEEPKQIVFFRTTSSLYGLAHWWLDAIAIRADLFAKDFAVTTAHECRHLWARNRETPAAEERDAVAWSESFYARHEGEIRNAALLLCQH